MNYEKGRPLHKGKSATKRRGNYDPTYEIIATQLKFAKKEFIKKGKTSLPKYWLDEISIEPETIRQEFRLCRDLHTLGALKYYESMRRKPKKMKKNLLIRKEETHDEFKKRRLNFCKKHLNEFKFNEYKNII